MDRVLVPGVVKDANISAVSVIVVMSVILVIYALVDFLFLRMQVAEAVPASKTVWFN